MAYPSDAVCACDFNCKSHANKLVCESRVWAKYLCRACYCRQRRHGYGRFARRSTCSVEGCDVVEYSRGMCNTHYAKTSRELNALNPRRSRA